MAAYGLDQPVHVQYFNYLKNILHGNLGISYTYRNMPVTKVLFSKFAPSALIGTQAMVLGITIGLILGILSAWRHNHVIDYITMVVAVLGCSVPNFVLAALLQYYFALQWKLLPVGFWTSWKCSILPSLSLCVGPIAQMARYVRTEMLDVLQQDYISTARAKGLSTAAVLVKHAVRNSIIPAITVIGPMTVNIITGSLAVESIFAVPGMGGLFVDCIKSNDYMVIMGLTLFFSTLYMLVIFITDILYAVIDPRMRVSLKES